MKKLLAYLMFFSIIALSGCTVDKNKPWVNLPNMYDGKGNTIGSDVNYFVVIIDNCQYIAMGLGNAQLLTHKGDCNNPIHYYSVEKQELKTKVTNDAIVSNIGKMEDLIKNLKQEVSK